MENIAESAVQLTPLLMLISLAIFGVDLYLIIRKYIKVKTKFYEDKLNEK
jgi:hypothetical protein